MSNNIHMTSGKLELHAGIEFPFLSGPPPEPRPDLQGNIGRTGEDIGDLCRDQMEKIRFLEKKNDADTVQKLEAERDKLVLMLKAETLRDAFLIMSGGKATWSLES